MVRFWWSWKKYVDLLVGHLGPKHCFWTVNGKPHLNSSSSLALQWPRQNATCRQAACFVDGFVHVSWFLFPLRQLFVFHNFIDGSQPSPTILNDSNFAGWASMQPLICASSNNKSTIPEGHSVIKMNLKLYKSLRVVKMCFFSICGISGLYLELKRLVWPFSGLNINIYIYMVSKKTWELFGFISDLGTLP